MDKLIKKAIVRCEKKIQSKKKIGIDPVFSESDFERLLVNEIERSLKRNKKTEYVVHTQISYYDGSEKSSPRYRVDILLMNNDKIKYKNSQHKAFVYGAEAYALEIKYLHKDDYVMNIRKDFRKAKRLIESNTVLYVVILLEEEDNNKKTIIKNLYLQYQKKIKKTSMLQCEVICKIKNNVVRQ